MPSDLSSTPLRVKSLIVSYLLLLNDGFIFLKLLRAGDSILFSLQALQGCELGLQLLSLGLSLLAPLVSLTHV